MGALQNADWYDQVNPRPQVVFRDSYLVDDATIKTYFRDHYKQLYDDGPYQAFLDYLKRTGREWKQVAPEPEFNRGQVSRWSRGLVRPSPENLEEIKRINQIRDEDLATPTPRMCRLAASAETLRMIRETRDPKPDPPHETIDAHQYHILEFIFLDLKTRVSSRNPVRDQFMTAIAQYVHREFPQARIRTLGDLERLLTDWIGPYVVFAGVMKRP